MQDDFYSQLCFIDIAHFLLTFQVNVSSLWKLFERLRPQNRFDDDVILIFYAKLALQLAKIIFQHLQKKLKSEQMVDDRIVVENRNATFSKGFINVHEFTVIEKSILYHLSCCSAPIHISGNNSVRKQLRTSFCW